MGDMFSPPRWLPGGHIQTIVPALFARVPHIAWQRVEWDTPDGDQVVVDSLLPLSTATAATLVLFHGLEGSSGSHYARHLAAAAASRNWQVVVPHFRGCGGRTNRLARAYHAGDSIEIGWMLNRIRELRPDGAFYVAGVSLGGNAMLKWLGERASDAARLVTAAAGISVPLDLTASGAQLDRGLNRVFYTREFLRTLKPKALEKLRLHPELGARIPTEPLRLVRTMREFDDRFTAPMHGFAGVDDYWARASSKPWLRHVKVPTLVLNARNDPFIPATCLPHADEVARCVRLDYPAHGGHAGFLNGAPWNMDNNWLPHRLFRFFETEAGALQRALTS